MEDNDTTVQFWSPQSSDFNPTEHSWNRLKRNATVNERTDKTIFINALYKKRNSIGRDIIKKLIRSVSNRPRAVTAAKGDRAKYQDVIYREMFEKV